MAQLPQPIPTLAFLGDLQGGGFLISLADAHQKVISGVHATGKTGEITIKLKFQAVSENTHKITPVITSKIPVPAPSSDMKFHDSAGRVFNTDPRQFNMNDELAPRRMSAVQGGKAPEFDPESGEVK